MGVVLVPVDFSEVTAEVVRRAGELARALGHRAVLLHVAEPEPDFVGYGVGPRPVRRSVAEHLREEHRQIEALAASLRERGVDAEALLVQGPTAATILEQAADLRAELIVIGSHGRGALYRALLGSVSADVLRGARQPVLVVPIRPTQPGSDPAG